MNRCKLTAFLILIAAAGPALAEDAKFDHGISLGVRGGYALPFGQVLNSSDVGTNTDLSRASKGVIPIWVDLGYRFSPNFYLGAFAQYGVGLTGSGCSGCDSQYELRFGANLHYHFLPHESLDPWFGIGAGYEILNTNVTILNSSGSISFQGFQFGNAQAGLDFVVSKNFSIGPFAMFSIGQYSKMSGDFGGISTSQSIPDKAIHEWLTFGLKGTFNIGVD